MSTKMPNCTFRLSLVLEPLASGSRYEPWPKLRRSVLPGNLTSYGRRLQEPLQLLSCDVSCEEIPADAQLASNFVLDAQDVVD